MTSSLVTSLWAEVGLVEFGKLSEFSASFYTRFSEESVRRAFEKVMPKMDSDEPLVPRNGDDLATTISRYAYKIAAMTKEVHELARKTKKTPKKVVTRHVRLADAAFIREVRAGKHGAEPTQSRMRASCRQCGKSIAPNEQRISFTIPSTEWYQITGHVHEDENRCREDEIIDSYYESLAEQVETEDAGVIWTN